MNAAEELACPLLGDEGYIIPPFFRRGCPLPLQQDRRFIAVYGLAVDAKPDRVMMWKAENLSLLRKFSACRSIKGSPEPFASTARGLYRFLSNPMTYGFNGLYGWGVRLFHQLDKLCFYLDGGGEVALLEVDEEAFVLAAPLAHQTALETVETAADDAYALAV